MSDYFFFHYGKYIILVCAIVGFIFWHKLKSLQTHYLPIFLSIVFIGESIGYYLVTNKEYNISESLYYYFLLPVQIIFYVWLIATKGLHKPKLALGLCITIILVLLLEIIITKNNSLYVISKSYAFGGIVLSFLVILYILKLVKSDLLLTFHQNIFFWIGLAVSIYYTLTFPYYTFYNTLLYKYESVFIVYRNLVGHLSFSMYLIFIIGFIWSKEN